MLPIPVVAADVSLVSSLSTVSFGPSVGVHLATSHDAMLKFGRVIDIIASPTFAGAPSLSLRLF